MNRKSWMLVAWFGFWIAACHPSIANSTIMEEMTTSRFGASVNQVGDLIYVIGGSPDNSVALSTVEVFDPVTNSWSAAIDMPTGRYFHGASVVDGKIVIVGGAEGPRQASSSVEVYDPKTDICSKGAVMPTSRFALSTSAVDGIVYAIGGGSGLQVLNRVEAYNPASNSWEVKADMSTARAWLSTSVVDGIIYAIGGVASPNGPALAVVEAYDPRTDTWSTRAPMPSERHSTGPNSPVFDGRIYVIGGQLDDIGITVGGGEIVSIVEVYDPKSDTWSTRTEMPINRAWLAATEFGDGIYIFGGATINPLEPTTLVEVLLP